MGAELVLDRLTRMVPSAIPDSALASYGPLERWIEMIVEAFKKVRVCTQRVGWAGLHTKSGLGWTAYKE